jgi:hypothetical protein
VDLKPPLAGRPGACPSLVPGSRYGHIQHVLPDGRVLVAGGWSSTLGNPANGRTSVLLFDPRRGTWTRARHDLPIDLAFAITTDLPDGRVLVAGGIYDNGLLDSHQSWIFDPRDETWTRGPGMPCITLDPIVTDAYGVPAGTTSLPSSTFNMQTGAIRLNDGRWVYSGGFNNEVFDGDWPPLSKRTYVFNPSKPARPTTCAPSALPVN